jgi:hypothetical protein
MAAGIIIDIIVILSSKNGNKIKEDRISVITDEEKLFLKHANKFLDESAIKPEHRNK